MVAYNVKELTNILIRNGLSTTCLISSASSYLLYNTQIPVFSSKISYIFLPPTFFLSCFTFMFHLIENHAFQELKHSASMFHFMFQCFIFYLPHTFPKNTLEEKSNPNGSDLKPQWERNQTSMGKTPLKHWNQKWNIELQCFISWNYWLSMHCVIKMKHETKNASR